MRYFPVALFSQLNIYNNTKQKRTRNRTSSVDLEKQNEKLENISQMIKRKASLILGAQQTYSS